MKGYKLSRDYDINDSLDNLEYEYDSIKSSIDKKNGLALARSVILNLASAAEYVNEKYDPFDFKLSGWSKQLSEEIDSWEDVLEELYEKYKGRGVKLPPEFRLVFFCILPSAVTFHITKKLTEPTKPRRGPPSPMNPTQNGMPPYIPNKTQSSPDKIPIPINKKHFNNMQEKPKRQSPKNISHETTPPVIEENDNVKAILNKIHKQSGIDNDNTTTVSDTKVSKKTKSRISLDV